MTNQEFIESISLEGEIWKDVIGYENSYLISSYGRVVSLSKRLNITNGYYRITLPKLLSTQIDKNGYIVVSLSHKGKTIQRKIHRLIATSFIPNPNNYPDIDHIDGNKKNNKLSNLRWVNKSMNMMDPITRLRNSESCKRRIGSKNPKSIPIIQLLQNGKAIFFESYKEIKTKYGYSHRIIKKHCEMKTPIYNSYWYFKSDYENLINKSKNESSDAES